MWITLTGFMATGKSTVADRLGRMLGRPVAALDERIARRAGLSIPAIFETHGEAAFREMELAELRALDPEEDWIVDPGGGVVETPEAVRVLRERGPVLWLDTGWEILHERLHGDAAADRPLATGLEPEELERLHRERLPRYAGAADFRLRADDWSADELARLVARRVRSWNKTGADRERTAS